MTITTEKVRGSRIVDAEEMRADKLIAGEREEDGIGLGSQGRAGQGKEFGKKETKQGQHWDSMAELGDVGIWHRSLVTLFVSLLPSGLGSHTYQIYHHVAYHGVA